MESMSLIQQYLSLVGGWKVLTIFIFIVVDTVLGIILAVKNKQFAWSKIANFINTSVLMMFGGYLVLGIVGMSNESLKAAVPGAMALIDAKLIADIVTKFRAMGLPINK